MPKNPRLFTLDSESESVLNNVKNKSEFVRDAIQEKWISELNKEKKPIEKPISTDMKNVRIIL